MEFLLSGEISIDAFADLRSSQLKGSARGEKPEKGRRERLVRGSSSGRRNTSAGPGKTSLYRRDDRNVPKRNVEGTVGAPKLVSPVREQRESAVLRTGGPASNIPGACGEHAGHESDANSIKPEDLGSGRHQSFPTFTSHERHSGAGASVPPDARNPECTCAINDRCLVRTQDGRRVVIAAGVVLAQYALDDRMAESYAMVTLVEQRLAKQIDVARAFGCSTRTLRRHQRRFADGGLAVLGRSPGYPRGRARVAGSGRQLV